MAKAVAAPVEDTIEKFGIDPNTLTPSETEQKVASTEGETVTLSAEEQEALAAEVAAIDAALEKLTERREQIKTQFRRLDYGTSVIHADSGMKVTVGKNPIFQEAKFLLAYPYDHSEIRDVVGEADRFGRKKIVSQRVFPNRQYYKITVDRQAIKSIPDYDELFFEQGEKKISFR